MVQYRRDALREENGYLDLEKVGYRENDDSEIRGITCATDYSFKKVLNFLKLQYGPNYEKYPPILDMDGNLIWPKKMTRSELRAEFKKERAKIKI